MLDRSSKVDDAFARLGIGLPEPEDLPVDDWQGPTEIPESADAERLIVEPAAPQPATLITPTQWPNEPPPPVE
jgi:hypothetical protein